MELQLNVSLDLGLYLSAFSRYPSHAGIQGGTIHEFLRGSKVVYRGGKVPVYYVEYWHNGSRAVIGGNYAGNGKPRLFPGELLDFN